MTSHHSGRLTDMAQGLAASGKPELAGVIQAIVVQLGALRGHAFIARLVPLLLKACDADYAFIGPLDASGSAVDAVCGSATSAGQDKLQFTLLGPPFEEVMQSAACCVSADGASVAQAFLTDSAEQSARFGQDTQACCAIALRAPDGSAVGLLAVLFARPLVDPAPVKALLTALAGYSAAQVQGAQVEQALELELDKAMKLQAQYQLLARQERDARYRAQKNNRVKSAFITSMSQEVKMPMTSMLAFCQMLLKSELDGNQRQQVKNMLDSGQQLMTMLNDVLELARLEDGIVELPESDIFTHQLLDDVVEQAVAHLQNSEVKLDFSISASVPPQLLLAEHHLQKVVGNLLSNAVASTARGEIHVSLDYQPVTDELGSLVVAVADTGSGIESARIGNIFELFNPPQDATGDCGAGGTALGLHLAHRLVKIMGGTIDLHSELGRGSVFTVRLPVALSEAAARHPRFDGVVGLVVLPANGATRHSVAADSLTFLGVQVHPLDGAQPLAPQLAQQPLAGVVVDASRSSEADGPLLRWLEEIHRAGLPAAAVADMRRQNTADAAHALSRVICVKPPVLMREWLEVIESFAGKASAMPAAPSNAQPEKRILLVEDNRLNQEIALCILEEAGYQVDIANNGEEAVRSMESNSADYQMVLMDIQMPVMDGLEATRIIRQRLNNAIPIVAVTAGIAVQDRQLCDDAGMDDFVPKPIDEEFVLQKVRYYMSGAHLA
ncbi:MAG TPA: response regulator [Marinagarivorans sp.]